MTLAYKTKPDKIYDKTVEGLRIRSKYDWYRKGKKSIKFLKLASAIFLKPIIYLISWINFHGYTFFSQVTEPIFKSIPQHSEL